MKADYLTFRRAASISFLGLGLQVVVATVLAIYGRYSNDHAATSAAAYLGIGVLVWGALGLLFDQHRRERIEAMEAESLEASGAAAASAFESAGEELHMAARRLATIQRFVLPIVSLLVGALLMGIGFWRFSGGRDLAQVDAFKLPEFSGFAIAVGLIAAFVGFVFARFVSGMAKEGAWAPLRAGASQMAGAALLGLAMTVAHFVQMATGTDWPLRYLQPAIPVFMMILGGEVFMNFILDLYRPRQAGDKLRPAFGSRVLGFLAAPDKIAESVGEALNYQFGVDLTGTWFYKLLSRSIMYLVLFAFVIGWALTGVVVLQPHQRGLVLVSGSIGAPLMSLGQTRQIERADGDSYTEIGPGLHLKLPWPFATVEIPEFTVRDGDKTYQIKTATGVRVLNLGSDPAESGKAVLWGKEHARREVLHIVQPIQTESDELGRDRAGAADLSLIAVEVPMHFVVSDVELFDRIATPSQRERLLGVIGKRVVTQLLSAMSADAVLATSRIDLPRNIKRALEAEYAKLNDGRGAGIKILFVGASGIHPPRKVAPNFMRVVQARQNYQAMIEDAERRKIATLTSIAGSVELAEQIVSQLNALETLERSGASTEELAELELDVQRLLEEAGGEAGEMLLTAGALRWKQHMGERGRAALFRGQETAYAAAPRLYQTMMYTDALLAAMRDIRVFLTPADMDGFNIRMELQDRESARDVFDTELGVENQ